MFEDAPDDASFFASQHEPRYVGVDPVQADDSGNAIAALPAGANAPACSPWERRECERAAPPVSAAVRQDLAPRTLFLDDASTLHPLHISGMGASSSEAPCMTAIWVHDDSSQIVFGNGATEAKPMHTTVAHPLMAAHASPGSPRGLQASGFMTAALDHGDAAMNRAGSSAATPRFVESQPAAHNAHVAAMRGLVVASGVARESSPLVAPSGNQAPAAAAVPRTATAWRPVGEDAANAQLQFADAELPELLEVCVRSELLHWLRTTPEVQEARTQVMRRVATVPSWSATAILADTLDAVCHAMAPLLSADTKMKLMAASTLGTVCRVEIGGHVCPDVAALPE